MTIEECLNAAYDVISKRTGKMVNGQFMKDETGHYGFINNNQTHT
jgi:hypothetical protein